MWPTWHQTESIFQLLVSFSQIQNNYSSATVMAELTFHQKNKHTHKHTAQYKASHSRILRALSGFWMPIPYITFRAWALCVRAVLRCTVQSTVTQRCCTKIYFKKWLQKCNAQCPHFVSRIENSNWKKGGINIVLHQQITLSLAQK